MFLGTLTPLDGATPDRHELVSTSSIRIAEIYENVKTGQISLALAYKYIDEIERSLSPALK